MVLMFVTDTTSNPHSPSCRIAHAVTGQRQSNPSYVLPHNSRLPGLRYNYVTEERVLGSAAPHWFVYRKDRFIKGVQGAQPPP